MNAAREFEEQRARFFDDYEQRDDYLEVRKGDQRGFGSCGEESNLIEFTNNIGSSLPVNRIKKIVDVRNFTDSLKGARKQE